MIAYFSNWVAAKKKSPVGCCTVFKRQDTIRSFPNGSKVSDLCYFTSSPDI